MPPGVSDPDGGDALVLFADASGLAPYGFQNLPPVTSIISTL